MQTGILASAATGNLTALKEIALESSQIIPLVMNKVCTLRLFILTPSVSNFYFNYYIGIYNATKDTGLLNDARNQ